MASTVPKTMRSLAINAYSKPSGFELLELPVPGLPDQDHVLVKVHAASINPADMEIAGGTFKYLVKSVRHPNTSTRGDLLGSQLSNLCLDSRSGLVLILQEQ
jgi:NADPH:quinone reductase-like Zn-dependent oxidoreductase